MIDTVMHARLRQRFSAVQVSFLTLIAISIAWQVWLIFAQEFNWDEFYYLGLVHDYLRGGLSKALQTFQVHLFTPLARLPGNEIDQLIAGRIVMLLCQAASLIALYRLCRIWTDRGPALLAVCAYALLPATLQHGAGFRADPLALAFSMTALAGMGRARSNWTSATAISLSIALAALVTIKVVFFAPAFAGVALWRLTRNADRKSDLRWLATIGVLTPIIGLVLYAAHQASLTGSSVSGSAEMARGAAYRMLLETPLFPRSRTLLDMLLRSPFQCLLLAVGLAMLLLNATRGTERIRALAILGCVAPILSFAIYRNAYPYFIPLIFAPAFTAVAFLAQSRNWPQTLRIVLVIMMAITAIPSLYWISHGRDQRDQRSVVSAVHEIFPAPVKMIDHDHMIATFPESGFLMSTWGMNNYLDGPAIFSDVLEKDVVPLLLVNGKPLQHAMGLIAQDPSFFALHPRDRTVLQDNFIPHWGPIWIAGKHVEVPAAGVELRILVPGTYTVEGLTIRIAGREVSSGETIKLDRGLYYVRSSIPGVLVLRWGDRLPRPAAPPPDKPLIGGY